MTVRVGSDRCIYAFTSEMSPVARATAGDTILFEAQDALGGQVQSEQDLLENLDFGRINPASGPVFVEGAAPGDTLVVRVRSIDTADRGAIVTGPGMGVLGDEIASPLSRILPIDDNEVVFEDLRLPARPMIGVIGVAPADGEYPTGTAHRHGGNMDTKEIVAGSTVYLPVRRPGGLLALGDVHAVMGDGEVCVSACECAASVEVEIDLIKSRCPAWPIVEVDGEILILVSLPTIDEALVEATSQAVSVLEAARNLSRGEAYLLASLAVDVRVSQLVDPNKTAKAAIPARILGRSIADLL